MPNSSHPKISRIFSNRLRLVFLSLTGWVNGYTNTDDLDTLLYKTILSSGLRRNSMSSYVSPGGYSVGMVACRSDDWPAIYLQIATIGYVWTSCVSNAKRKNLYRSIQIAGVKSHKNPTGAHIRRSIQQFLLCRRLLWPRRLNSSRPAIKIEQSTSDVITFEKFRDSQTIKASGLTTRASLVSVR